MTHVSSRTLGSIVAIAAMVAVPVAESFGAGRSGDMNKKLPSLFALLGLALPASALDVSAILSKPTANNPQFGNKEAWPNLVGDEYFRKQKWPKGRVLIWAHASKSFGRSDTKPDPLDPASWIDAATGKPADAMPDMDTDIILPDADKPYKVTFKGAKHRACRHLTVGRNATFEPGGGGALAVFGNVWIRPGGSLFVYRSLHLTGGRDTFFRNDWPADGKLKALHDTGAITPFDPAIPRRANPWSWRASRTLSVCHFFRHDKPSATTEILGCVSSRDECNFLAGTFIVGRDSRFLCGGAAMLNVGKDGAIALMDGAMIGKTINQFGLCCRVQGGVVSAGLPDRPIQRDARLGLGYSNWMNLSFPDQRYNSRRGNAYDYGKFSGDLSGALVGHPAKGADARLVIGWQRISAGGGGRGVNATDGFNRTFAKLQPKITVYVNADTKIEDVRFEDLHRGGIVTPNVAIAAKWKDVTFGEGCLGKNVKELFREYKGKIIRGRPVDKLKPDREEYLTP